MMKSDTNDRRFYKSKSEISSRKGEYQKDIDNEISETTDIYRVNR